jgi:hypothetical protein
VLESITFDHPRSEKLDWWCIEGGSEVLINKMLLKVTNPPSYNHRVTAVSEEFSWQNPLRRMKVSVQDKEDEYFSHVVSTVTFSVLRTINTAGVNMNFNQREAMRALNYGQSIKVGIKFNTRWWEQNIAKAPQVGGASRTDRQVRVVVYPSYGLNETGPGVLMVSYNWWVPPLSPARRIALNLLFSYLTGIKMLRVSVLSSGTPSPVSNSLNRTALARHGRGYFSIRYTKTLLYCTPRTTPTRRT